jgi:hypothetical protein
MKNFLKLTAVAGLVMGVVGARGAIDLNDHLKIDGSIDGSLQRIGYVNNGQGGSSYENVYSGAFSVKVTDYSQGTVQNPVQYSILTFCTDVGVNWQSGQNYTALAFGSLNGVNPKWSAVPQAIQNASYLYNDYFVPNASSFTADQAAGIQLAIWKVLYDTGTDGLLTSTDFAHGNLLAYGFGTTAMDDASAYLEDVQTARGNPSTFPVYSDTWLKPDLNNSQGLLYNNSTPSSHVVPVPETTSLLAGALLLLPLGASTLRIVRRNRA